MAYGYPAHRVEIQLHRHMYIVVTSLHAYVCIHIVMELLFSQCNGCAAVAVVIRIDINGDLMSSE